MDSVVTVDYSKFGYKELEIAGKLLSLYAEYGANFLNEGLTVNFNIHSGYVFLSDSDFNVGVLDDSEEHIVQFFSCYECSYEGTQEQAENEGKDFVTYGGFCSKECGLKNL